MARRRQGAFCLAPDRKLMAERQDDVRGRSRQRAVELPALDCAVAADGRRFLLNAPLEEATGRTATVMLNWTAGLKAQ